MKLSLPNVTLCTIDTVCHDLCALAIKECLDKVDFGDAKIFSDKKICEDTVLINGFSNTKELERFSHYKMPSFIKTDFVLMIQWDSWVLDTGMWNNDYLAYDYIGAPWWRDGELNVGNSGFCLTSIELMNYLIDHEDEFPVIHPYDETLCRKYQPRLPQFKWAPQGLAQDFSFERTRPAIDSRHFGFHGLFNWPFIMTPDKLAERMAIARSNPHIQRSMALVEVDDIGTARWRKLKTGVK